MGKYAQDAKELLRLVGGKENIVQAGSKSPAAFLVSEGIGNHGILVKLVCFGTEIGRGIGYDVCAVKRGVMQTG